MYNMMIIEDHNKNQPIHIILTRYMEVPLVLNDSW